MKLLSTEQIRQADKYTIENEPISSVDLMERAASAACDAILKSTDVDSSFFIFCGTGNNGGDGFVVARLLLEKGRDVKVFWIKLIDKVSADCNVNYNRLIDIDKDVVTIFGEDYENKLESLFSNSKDCDVVVDAMFGSGLNRCLSDDYKPLFDCVNACGLKVISIDIPSGLFGDWVKVDDMRNVIQADETITFQMPKLSLLLKDNYRYVGNVNVVDIGLSKDFLLQAKSDVEFVDIAYCSKFVKRRRKFDHKGVFGHGLLVVGSEDKFGAAVLSAKACMRSGIGLLTVDIPDSCRMAMNVSLPEAMIDNVAGGNLLNINAIGIGPGLNTDSSSLGRFMSVLDFIDAASSQGKIVNLVVDADGLNLMAKDVSLLKRLKHDTILTPHPKEFSRLFGETCSDIERISLQKKMSMQYGLIIVYKTAYTMITMPDGRIFINSSGNAGMATAGSGDVLTGIVTGLLSRGYSPEEAAVLGVFAHGLAGDCAAKRYGMESMMASDIVDNINIDSLLCDN